MTRQEKLNFIAANYMRAMWTKAYSVISDAHEAEDACQEAFIKIIRVIDQVEDVTELRAKALCCIIAKNAAIDLARRNKRTTPAEEGFIDFEAEAPEHESPEAVAASNEGVAKLSEMIDRLPETYRDVLKLRCLYELSAEQTAEILKTNANTVNIRLSRARRLLKTMMEEDTAEEPAEETDAEQEK